MTHKTVIESELIFETENHWLQQHSTPTNAARWKWPLIEKLVSTLNNRHLIHGWELSFRGTGTSRIYTPNKSDSLLQCDDFLVTVSQKFFNSPSSEQFCVWHTDTSNDFKVFCELQIYLYLPQGPANCTDHSAITSFRVVSSPFLDRDE